MKVSDSASCFSDPVSKLYMKVSDPVSKLYMKVSDPVSKLYMKVSDPVSKLYMKVSDPVSKLYMKVSDPVSKLYMKVSDPSKVASYKCKCQGLTQKLSTQHLTDIIFAWHLTFAQTQRNSPDISTTFNLPTGWPPLWHWQEEMCVQGGEQCAVRPMAARNTAVFCLEAEHAQSR